MTCDDGGELGGVYAGGNLLRRGAGAEAAFAGQASQLPEDRDWIHRLVLSVCTFFLRNMVVVWRVGSRRRERKIQFYGIMVLSQCSEIWVATINA